MCDPVYYVNSPHPISALYFSDLQKDTLIVGDQNGGIQLWNLKSWRQGIQRQILDYGIKHDTYFGFRYFFFHLKSLPCKNGSFALPFFAIT